jgi:hypothetical protein
VFYDIQGNFRVGSVEPDAVLQALQKTATRRCWRCEYLGARTLALKGGFAISRWMPSSKVSGAVLSVTVLNGEAYVNYQVSLLYFRIGAVVAGALLGLAGCCGAFQRGDAWTTICAWPLLAVCVVLAVYFLNKAFCAELFRRHLENALRGTEIGIVPRDAATRHA